MHSEHYCNSDQRRRKKETNWNTVVVLKNEKIRLVLKEDTETDEQRHLLPTAYPVSTKSTLPPTQQFFRAAPSAQPTAQMSFSPNEVPENPNTTNKLTQPRHFGAT